MPCVWLKVDVSLFFYFLPLVMFYDSMLLCCWIMVVIFPDVVMFHFKLLFV